MSRLRSIAGLGLHLLSWDKDGIEELYRIPKKHSYDVYSDVNFEIEIRDQRFHPFDSEEIDQVIHWGQLKKGKNGNIRTKELLLVALTYLHEDIQQMEHLKMSPQNCEKHYNYLYDLDYYDGCVTIDGQRIKFPTSEEVLHLLNNMDSVTKKFPPIKSSRLQRSWDVYLNGIILDTVFFLPATTKNHVYRSLVSHDKYDPSIKLAWR